MISTVLGVYAVLVCFAVIYVSPPIFFVVLAALMGVAVVGILISVRRWAASLPITIQLWRDIGKSISEDIDEANKKINEIKGEIKNCTLTLGESLLRTLKSIAPVVGVGMKLFGIAYDNKIAEYGSDLVDGFGKSRGKRHELDILEQRLEAAIIARDQLIIRLSEQCKFLKKLEEQQANPSKRLYIEIGASVWIGLVAAVFVAL
jgi:hypothetical protein